MRPSRARRSTTERFTVINFLECPAWSKAQRPLFQKAAARILPRILWWRRSCSVGLLRNSLRSKARAATQLMSPSSSAAGLHEQIVIVCYGWGKRGFSCHGCSWHCFSREATCKRAHNHKLLALVRVWVTRETIGWLSVTQHKCSGSTHFLFWLTGWLSQGLTPFQEVEFEC